MEPTDRRTNEPIRPYAWYTLAVLLVAYVFAFIDRHVLNLLVEPIKRDFELSDTQISLVQGFGFAMFLSLAALPIGRAVDTRRRTVVLACGVAVWSLATIGCGVATSLAGFVLARVVVGAGEATMTPTAMSLIGDRFSRQRMGLATALYALGVHVGSGLALVMGAYAVRHASGSVPLPWGGVLQGWRAVFICLGLPGFLVAGWCVSLREPARGAMAMQVSSVVPLRAAFVFLRRAGAAMGFVNLAVAFALMASYGIAAWLPSFFIRHHGWTASAIGGAYGPVVIVSGVVGALAGGVVGDRVAIVHPDARLWIVSVSAFVAVPFAAIAPAVSSPIVAIGLFGAANLFIAAAAAAGPPLLQGLAPAEMRGVTHAVALLTVNVLALGLGPTLVAAFTDHVLGDELLVGRSLTVVPPAMLLVAGTLAIVGRPSVRRHLGWIAGLS